MRALVIIGHPVPDSFNHALAQTVVETWAAAGYAVNCHDLVAEAFDPCLTAAEARGMPSADPLVQQHIRHLRESDVLAVIHPNYWGAPPAIVKGWVDRVFAPDAAYTFEKGEDRGDVPIGLLPIQAALVLNTGNTPLAREHAVFGDPLERQWKACLLQYCGVQEVRRALFGPLATSTRIERQQWLTNAAALAQDVIQLASTRR